MFRESLKKMVDRVEGGVAGILMGFDGIAVESYMKEGEACDIQTVGMEFSHIVNQVKKGAELLEIGRLKEVTIKAENLIVVIDALNDEYFVACAIKPDGNFGKARYLIRLLIPQIQSEL